MPLRYSYLNDTNSISQDLEFRLRTTQLILVVFIAMNAVIQSQLDRVEAALNTLIDSITSYNPSINAAADLLAADDELNNGVQQCK